LRTFVEQAYTTDIYVGATDILPSVPARRSAILFPFETRGTVRELRPPKLISSPIRSAPNPFPNHSPTATNQFPPFLSLSISYSATKPRIGRDKNASIRRIGFFKPFENGWVISKPTPSRNGPPRPRLLHHKEPANSRVSRNRLTTASPPT
jgi:hypothetical protein